MEKINIKCSSKEHIESDSISFCQICQIYMCNKCDNIHAKLCPNHCPYNLNKDLKEIFTGICAEEQHLNKLEYFCKTHNELCCVACISKIKGKGNGQHTDCTVCFIEDIKENKKNKLSENIKCLEVLSLSFQESINEIKKLFDVIEKDKESLKIKAQKIFTKLRNCLNEREDEILLEIDKTFDSIFLNKEIIKEGENLPNKIKNYLEKGKIIEKDWNNDNLKLMINDCVNIENNIKYINEINENLKKYKVNNYDIQFSPEENEIDEFIEKIKRFGNIIHFNNNWIDSNIMKNQKEKEKMKNLISPNNNVKAELLYRLSKDGESINKYHQLCDNIKNNLILIKSDNDVIFGCYCTWMWDTSGKDIDSNDGFLFNLTKDKKYSNQKLRIHKGCSDHGPYIYSKFYFDGSMKRCNITGKEFTDSSGYKNIKEVEIYKII